MREEGIDLQPAYLPGVPQLVKDRWSQSLEVTFGELMSSGEPPLLKHRRELIRNEAIKLWAQKRRAGWQVCDPQWTPPPLRRD